MTNSLSRLQVKIFFHLVAALLLPAPDAQAQPALSRLFVDCIECDSDYLRQELTFVDLVRDRQLADVSAMVTALSTGSGGRAFTIETFGKIGGRVIADTVVVNVAPDATAIERRQAIVRSLKLAILPFIRSSGVIPHIDVTYSPPDKTSAKGARDPWNHWVFNLHGSGSFGSDDNYSARGIDTQFGASRVTDRVKLDISGRGAFNREKFRLDDGTTLVSDRRSRSVKALAVWSLGNHYSAGFTSSAGSSAFENTRYQLRFMPAIEYDLFPYKEATRRQVIVRYGAGFRSMKYVDTTIYNRTEESRPIHELTTVTDIRQTWGAVWGSATWSQYLHDTAKRRLALNGGIDWRIVRGLTLNFGASYSVIRDQLNIRGANLTNEERLLKLRETESGYSASAGLGLSYTFGSVFSNIVNSRFRL